RLHATDLQTIELVKSGTDTYLLVGGQGGVFRAKVPPRAGPTDLFQEQPVWTELGRNMPNVLVTDLVYNQADNVLVAATFGRGAFKITNIRGELASEASVVVPGTAGADTVTLSLDAADPTVLVVSGIDASPVKVPLSSVREITVNLMGGDDIL